VFEVAGLMIAAELAQRGLVELQQDLAQLLGSGIAGGEALPVDLAQCADEGSAVLVADFAVLVAVIVRFFSIPIWPKRGFIAAG